MSAGAEPTTLPGISTIKTSLVEVAMSNTPRSPPPCGGDELLGGSVGADAWSKASGTPPALLPGRRMSPQQAGGASQRAATSPLYLPRPPSTPPRESTTGKLRRVRKAVNQYKAVLCRPTAYTVLLLAEPGVYSPLQERVG